MMAFEDGDYITAASLADEASNLAKPPYLLYGGIGLAIVIAGIIIYWYRIRKS